MIVFILQLRDIKHREVSSLASGHTVGSRRRRGPHILLHQPPTVTISQTHRTPTSILDM